MRGDFYRGFEKKAFLFKKKPPKMDPALGALLGVSGGALGGLAGILGKDYIEDENKKKFVVPLAMAAGAGAGLYGANKITKLIDRGTEGIGSLIPNLPLI